jgi:hypothetical protein
MHTLLVCQNLFQIEALCIHVYAFELALTLLSLSTSRYQLKLLYFDYAILMQLFFRSVHTYGLTCSS